MWPHAGELSAPPSPSTFRAVVAQTKSLILPTVFSISLSSMSVWFQFCLVFLLTSFILVTLLSFICLVIFKILALWIFQDYSLISSSKLPICYLAKSFSKWIISSCVVFCGKPPSAVIVFLWNHADHPLCGSLTTEWFFQCFCQVSQKLHRSRPHFIPIPQLRVKFILQPWQGLTWGFCCL